MWDRQFKKNKKNKGKKKQKNKIVWYKGEIQKAAKQDETYRWDRYGEIWGGDPQQSLEIETEGSQQHE